MEKITQKKLQEILEKHKKWLNGEVGGERAILSNADLRNADLSNADLRNADLRNADLRNADLSNAYLSNAYLSNADLSNAYLSNAYLSNADLSNADLSNAYLSNADLRYADLRNAFLRNANLRIAYLSNADLSNANLRNADLRNADLSNAYLNCNTKIDFYAYACPDFGAFIGYKKASGYIVVLEILADAQRLSATTRKCRCDKAKVIAIENLNKDEPCDLTEVSSDRDKNFIYKIGEIVKVDNFDTNRWNECSTGIHFFINRQEAVNY